MTPDSTAHDAQTAAPERDYDPSTETPCAEAGPGSLVYVCTRPKGHPGAHIARDSRGDECDRWTASSARTEQGVDLDARDAFLAFRGPRPHAHGDPDSPLWDFDGKQWDHDRALYAAGWDDSRSRLSPGSEATDDELQLLLTSPVGTGSDEYNEGWMHAMNLVAKTLAARRSVSATPDAPMLTESIANTMDRIEAAALRASVPPHIEETPHG